MFALPGHSFRGQLPPLDAEELIACDRLRRHVGMLAEDIGERNVGRRAALDGAATYIETQLAALGYTVNHQSYTVADKQVRNIEAVLPGSSRSYEIVVIGAHYDTVPGCPGANDNGSGTAALLELARLYAGRAYPRTVRFVAFVNEEPPFFMTEQMGSLVYARRCRARRERIAAMFSLETIGYYSAKRGSQQYPGPRLLRRMYPDTGDFIAFVANIASRKLLRETARHFRRTCRFPSEAAAVPATIAGVGWSDHWSFWQQGYSAVMLTDTAPFRYPHYHLSTDTPDKLDYDSLSRVVMGLSRAFAEVAGGM
jgi:Zn-dependent M28 family amino/carboxypeptidase